MTTTSDGGHRQDADCAEIDEHRGTQAMAPATDPLANLGAALPSGDPQEQSMNEWQPIETAPKDGTWFLGYEDGAQFVMRWDTDTHGRAGSHAWRDQECFRYDPTHWMPLPAPPLARPTQENVYRFCVDDRRHESRHSLLTAMEIKGIAGVPSDHNLLCQLKTLLDDERIDVDGKEFYSTPQAHW